MRNKATQVNIDNSDSFNYPNARIRNNDGSGNGTLVDESVYGDLHETKDKFMREAKIPHNNLPDNTTNGYQLYEAMTSVGGKNDMIKSLFKINDTTLSIPIKIEALQVDETLIFKTDFNSTNQMIKIIGSDNVEKSLSISGSFKIGQKVRLINNQNSINLIGLYDEEILPGLIQNIADINNTFSNLTKILSVFVQNGAMVFWNKPANEIPNGWAEVVNWRGRFPVGLDVSQDEFNVLSKEGGVKSVTLTSSQIPSVNFSIPVGKEKVGTGNQNAASANGGNAGALNGTTSGGGGPHNNLPPYRTVLFIEYIG